MDPASMTKTDGNYLHTTYQYLSQFLSHLFVFDGALQRWRSLSREFVRAIGRAGAQVRTELADVVEEVDPHWF